MDGLRITLVDRCVVGISGLSHVFVQLEWSQHYETCFREEFGVKLRKLLRVWKIVQDEGKSDPRRLLVAFTVVKRGSPAWSMERGNGRLWKVR